MQLDKLQLGPRLLIAFGLSYGAIGAFSLWLSESLHSSATPWPANAIFIALLCRFPQTLRHQALAAIGFAMTVLSAWQSHQPLPVALSFGVITILEIGLGTWLIADYLRIDFQRLTTLGAMRGFLLAGVLAALPSSLLFGVLAASTLGQSFVPAFLQRWHDSILMFAILAPPILFYTNEGFRKLCSRTHRWENLAYPLLNMLLVYVCLRYVPFSFVTLIVPLLIIAYRQGPLGAALNGMLVSLETILLWVTYSLPSLSASIGADPLASIPLFAMASMVLAPTALSLGVVERRATINALKAAERETAEIIDRSPTSIAVVAYRAEGATLNDAFLRMLGREDEKGSLISSDSFMDPAELEVDRSAATEVLARTRDCIRGTRRYRHRDGSWMRVQVTAALIRNADGTPKRWLLQAENVEEQLRSELRVQAERERLRVTLECVGEGILTIDSAGVITYANSAALMTLGQGLSTVLGQTVSRILTLTDMRTGQPVRSMLARATLNGESVQREEAVVLHKPDGSLRYVRDTVSPLQRGKGMVSGWVMALHDVTDSQMRELDVRKRAETDAVTGLANRHSFLARVDKVFKRVRASGSEACILAIDLDRFKVVNDSGGHAAGDKMLSAVGETIVGIVRSSDLVARIGGDEFAVVLERCETQAALQIAARLVVAIQIRMIVHHGTEHSVGASIGVAAVGETFPDATQWLAAADAECYRAKHEGGGQACCAA